MPPITPYWGLDGILLLTSFFVIAYLYMTRKFNYWKKRGIAEIRPTPFTGNFADCILMRKPAGAFVKELYDNSKGLPCLGFFVLDKPMLLIRDPELVKHVLVKDFNYFSDRYVSADVHDRIGYANLFIIKNPEWKMLRTKLTPVFTSGKLKKMFELILEVGKDFDAHMKSLNLEGDGKTLEVKELCAQFMTDIIASTAFGLKVNSLSNPDAEFRKYGRKIFDYTTFRAYEMLTSFFTPGLVKYLGFKFFGKESSNFLSAVFCDTITQRINSGIKRNDLIDILIELKKQNENSKDLGTFRFDGDDLAAQATVFFTGGFETSSTTMAFALYELALQPELQTRLRNEIHEALEKNNGEVTYDMVMTLPYLDMVIGESLRKYPTLPFLDRVAVEDYKLPNSDVILEKGTPVYISMTGMHYDPEYFPDPEKFDPERFSEENKKNIKPHVYFPFGEGPHNCIGIRLGYLQSKYGIIEILKNYEVAPCKETLIPMKLDPKALITKPLGGLYLNVRKLKTKAG